MAEIGVPQVVYEYFDALGRSDVAAAVGCFTDDVFYSHPPFAAGDLEQQRPFLRANERVEVSGSDDLRTLLDARGSGAPVTIDIQYGLVAGDTSLFRGAVGRDGTTLSSFVSRAEIDRATGRMRHYEAYTSSPPVNIAGQAGPHRTVTPTGAPDGDAPEPPGGAARPVHDYFDALDRFDLDAVVACFSDDALYSHPPYRGRRVEEFRAAPAPGARVEVRGSTALRHLFEDRGDVAIGHELTVVAAGPTAFVHGYTTGADEVRGSFVSFALVDDDAARISHYEAYRCAPAAGAGR